MKLRVSMKQFETLLSIAKRKSEIDKLSDWSNGSETYLSEIKMKLMKLSKNCLKIAYVILKTN